MKRVGGVLLLAVLCFFGPQIRPLMADMIYLKNGKKFQGTIVRETADYIELRIEIGKVGFFTKDIESITRSSPQERALMESRWQEEEDRKKRSRSVQSRGVGSRGKSTSIRYSREISDSEMEEDKEVYERRLEALKIKEEELRAREDDLEEKERELYSLEKELGEKEDELEEWEEKLKDKEYELKIREREAPKTIYVGPGRKLEGELISGGDNWEEK